MTDYFNLGPKGRCLGGISPWWRANARHGGIWGRVFFRQHEQSVQKTPVRKIHYVFDDLKRSLWLIKNGWCQLHLFPRAAIGATVVRNQPANAGGAGDTGSNPGSGRSAGERNGSPLQYSCLENLMDKGAWWSIDHRITKSWTWLKQLTCTHTQVSGTVLSV